MEFVGALASALDARDPYTAGHSARVSQYATAVARAMHLDEADLHTIEMGGLLHDIGKIGISDSVLQKPGKLTGEEFAMIREHPSIGRRILGGRQRLSAVSPYCGAAPRKLGWQRISDGDCAASETPLLARIVHVVDAYDAMTSNRSYRHGLGHEEAVRRLRTRRGHAVRCADCRRFHRAGQRRKRRLGRAESGTSAARSPKRTWPQWRQHTYENKH